jgi:hypothetical protein
MSESRDTVRRDASDPLLIYDIEKNEPLGQVINLSDRGFKIMSELPIEAYKIFNCRMTIPEGLAASDEITFFAECRWCRQNQETTWYDSGFYIRRILPEDVKIIQSLRRKWMIEQSNKKGTGDTIIKTKDEKKGFLERLFG